MLQTSEVNRDYDLRKNKMAERIASRQVTDMPRHDVEVKRKQGRMPVKNGKLVELAAVIISAFVANNNVTSSDLPGVIASVHASLTELGGEPDAPPAAPLVPAIPIRKSVTPDAIVCLEEGRSFESRKRHLSSKYGLTPEQYRIKWGLPTDYPMVAPAYAEARSALEKSMGLGRVP